MDWPHAHLPLAGANSNRDGHAPALNPSPKRTDKSGNLQFHLTAHSPRLQRFSR